MSQWPLKLGEHVPQEACMTIHWVIERNIKITEFPFIFYPFPIFCCMFSNEYNPIRTAVNIQLIIR